MIGYHYTTKLAWENSISEHGLFPHRIRKHELEKFRQSLPRLPEAAIWVWQCPLTNEQAWIVATTLAAMHDEYELVLLKVEYSWDNAASLLYNDEPIDDFASVNLNCSFGMGGLDTGSLPIELLVNHIPPEQIECIWETDMMCSVYGRHPTEELVRPYIVESEESAQPA